MTLSGFQTVRGHGRQAAFLGRLGVPVCLYVVMTGAAGRAIACEKADFEAVVTDAANALRDLNQKNKPPFQARLKDLKEKRGWSHDQFLKEAAPLVQDAKIAEFDERSAGFLEKIQTMGADGPGAPQCSALGEVRGVMQKLVEAQKDKWTYMFSMIEQEMKR